MPTQSEADKSTVKKGALPPVPEKVDLGSILLRDGKITQGQLDECLGLQAALGQTAGAHVPRLGEFLVQKGYVTEEAIQRALREQAKKILFCASCNILINVETRPDAIGYRCGRCEGDLIDPPAGHKEKTVESSIIVNSRIPVPEEVRTAKEDPARRFGKYVLLGEIGRGGIASVYRAWDTYLNQYVALKRIRPAPAGSSMVRQTRVASLLNEAHNAIRLRHPNIVSVYDIGRVGNEYYISMEFLDGRTMFDEVKAARERGMLSPFHEDPKKWMGILYQVAHAVYYAHSRPVPTFHCDLKPGNVMITKEDAPYILDFGLARHVGEVETEQGIVCGTPAYMSPEQASGRNDQIDARTDVYGLGAILYELLAGQPPFVGDMGDVLRRTVSEMPPRPGDVASPRPKVGAGAGTTHRLRLVPQDLEDLCMRSLRKEREERPQNALEFARELEAIAAGGRTTLPRQQTASSLLFAVPPPPRRRVSWMTLSLVVLTALVLGAWGSWMARRHFAEQMSPEELALQARERLGAFRPDLVKQLDPGLADEVLHRMHYISALKERLSAAILERKPVLPELTVGPRTLRNVKVARAKEAVVLFVVDDTPDEAPWSALGPVAIVALARACGILDQSPENRYGLALYCHSAGAKGLSRDLFQSLDGTWLASFARTYLAELNQR